MAKQRAKSGDFWAEIDNENWWVETFIMALSLSNVSLSLFLYFLLNKTLVIVEIGGENIVSSVARTQWIAD